MLYHGKLCFGGGSCKGNKEGWNIFAVALEI